MPLTVRYTVAYDAGSSTSATPALDFRPLSGTVVIPAGAESADIVIRPLDDDEVEGDESFQIILADPLASPSPEPAYVLGTPSEKSVKILDNDFDGPRPIVSIGRSTDGTDDGSEPSTPARFHVTLSEADGKALTVSYRVDQASTASANDYKTLTGTVTIAANTTSADIVVTPVDDLRWEGDETVKITLTGIVLAGATAADANQLRYVLSSTPATVTIHDNEQAPLPVIALKERHDAYEGGAAGSFVLERTGSTTSQLTVNYEINWLQAANFAKIGTDFQYTPGTSTQNKTSGSVVFPANQATVTIAIDATNTFNDPDVEPDEPVYLRIKLSTPTSSSYTVGSRSSRYLYIRDDDGAQTGPYVAAIALSRDTGTPGDKITWISQIEGTVGGIGTATPTVQFGHAEPGVGVVIDDDFEVTSPSGYFWYDPGYVTLGPRTVLYRVITLSGGDIDWSTPWQTFSFQLVENPTIGPVRLTDVHLVSYLENNPSQNLTTVAAIAGTVRGIFPSPTVRLEFDPYGDGSGNFDSIDVLSSGDRSFVYDAKVRYANVASEDGQFALAYRVLSATGDVLCDWQTIDMTLVEPPPSNLTVENLAVEQATSEIAAGDWILTGQISGSAGQPAGGSGDFPADPTTAGDSGGVAFAQVDLSLVSRVFDEQTQTEVEVEDPLGRVTADQDGRFSYSLVGLGYGAFTIRARAIERSSQYAAELIGNPSDLDITLDPPPVPDIDPESLKVEDLTDDGKAPASGVTIVGRIVPTSFDPTTLAVQFDHNPGDDDDIVDIEGHKRGFTAVGQVSVAADGSFRYLPRILPTGQISIEARVVRWVWDSAQNDVVLVPGPVTITPLTFTLDPPEIPIVNRLELFADTGDEITGPLTTIRTLVGSIDPGREGVEIQFQYDSDSDTTIEGYTTSQADGKFVFDPLGLAAGLHTVRARAAVWDENRQQTVTSAWNDITVGSLIFTLQNPTNDPPTVTQFGLRNRTGGTDTSPITTDATLTGQVNNDGSVSYLTVEFDHDPTGSTFVVDGTVMTDASGNFVYVPSGLAPGPHIIAARAVEWDAPRVQKLYGDPKALAFQLEAVTNLPARVQEFALLSDSGNDSTDHLTANATLIGRVTDDHGIVANVTVEFEHDGNGSVDGVTSTDDQGKFRYEAVGLTYGALPVTILARAVEWDAAARTYLGRNNWTDSGVSLTFTYQQQTNEPPRLIELTTGNPLPGADPTRPSLQGRVTNEGAVKDVAVDFDFNNDSAADQSATTDENGRFSIQPQGLGFGNPASIHYKTRETDPVTRQILTQPNWLAWPNLNYSQIVTAIAEIDTLTLVNRTGGTAENPSTTDPRIRGAINRPGLGQFVIVQFAQDANFAAIDGQVVVGSDLNFTYNPGGLIPGRDINLYARTKDVDRNGTVIYGNQPLQNLPFTFRLESLTDQPLAISDLQLSLSGDTVSGLLTGVRSGETPSIEIDEDGNGTPDSPASLSASGQFTFTSASPPVNSSTLYVRGVATFDDPSGGTSTRRGEWTSLGFSLADAARQRDGAEASTAYDTAVGGAISSRNDKVNAAKQAYENALATANAAYAQAMKDAGNDLGSAVAALPVADRTSFDFQPFAWPELPPQNRLQLPDDPTQPLPPQYAGPEFQWQSDSGYLAAKAGFEKAYYEATRSANSQFDDGTRGAQSPYDDDVKQANETYRQALAEAEREYRRALQDESGKPDLQQDNQDHRDRMQDAWDAYRAAVEGNNQIYRNARKAAQQTLDGDIAAANQTFNDKRADAWDDYDNCMATNSNDAAQCRSAELAARQTEFDAAKERDKSIADARHTYDGTVNDAVKSHTQDNAVAWANYQKDISDSTMQFEKKLAPYNQWLTIRQINAKAALEQAKIDAQKVRVKKVADAEKVRAEKVANYEAIRTHKLAVATADRWKAEVLARSSAYASWNAAQTPPNAPLGTQGTPWSNYQLALVSAECNYIWGNALCQGNATLGRAAAYLEHADTVAGYASLPEDPSDPSPNPAGLTGALKLAYDQAEAARQRAYEQADADWKRAGKQRDPDTQQCSGRLAAKADYWRAIAGAQPECVAEEEGEEGREGEADHRKTYRDDVTDHGADYSKALADAYWTYADSLSEAYHDADASQIDARQFKVSNDPNDPYYSGREYVDRTDSINISGGLQHDLADAQFQYQLDQLAAAQTYQKAQLDDAKTLQDDLRGSRQTEADRLADALATYQKAVAKADEEYAIDNVHDTGVLNIADATADVIFVGVQADADKVFAVADATFLAAEHVEDADVEIAFRMALGGVNTDAEAAKVAYVTALASADITYATDTAEADRGLASGQADASYWRTTRIAAANDYFATNLGAKKLDFAEKLADKVKDNTKARNDHAAGPDAERTTADAGEITLQKASIDAEFAFQRAVREAAHTYQGAAIDAWVALALARADDDADETAQTEADNAYNVALETAAADYEAEVKAAWETLRTARSDAIGKRAERYAALPEKQKLAAAQDDASLAGERGTLENELAGWTKSYTTILATKLASADMLYALALAGANSRYDRSLAAAQRDHGLRTSAAEVSLAVALDAAASADREAAAAARGQREADLFDQHADLLEAIAAGPSTSPLAVYQAAIARWDATEAEGRRVARNTYEQALTTASYWHTQTVTAAQTDRDGTSVWADYWYQYDVAGYHSNLALATASADWDLAVRNATADAVRAESETKAHVAYDNANATALVKLNEDLRDAQTTYATALAGAQEQLYEDTADDWQPWIAAPYAGGGWFGYYGWDGFGYIDYVNWSYFAYWRNGGYVFGPSYDSGTGILPVFDSFYGYDYALGWTWDWGLGLASYTGYGWWNGWYDPAASDAYQKSMQEAGDVRQEQIACAQQRYILGTTPAGCESHEGDQDFVGLGQAQINLATDLGDANIAQATARGEAAKSWRLGIDGAESGFAFKERGEAGARRNFVLGAERDYAIAVASSRRDEVKDEQDANVVLTDMEGAAAIGAARERARAEVTYQFATAEAEAVRLAPALSSTTATLQQRYEAAYASAKAQWIWSLSDAYSPQYSTDGPYVAHAAGVAQAEAYVQPHLLAAAWRTRETARAAADYQFAVETANLL